MEDTCYPCPEAEACGLYFQIFEQYLVFYGNPHTYRVQTRLPFQRLAGYPGVKMESI